MSSTRLTILAAALALLAPALAAGQPPQGPTLTVRADGTPYAGLSDPDTRPVGGAPNFEQDVEVALATTEIELAWPTFHDEGRTMLQHGVGAEIVDLMYRNWNDGQGGAQVDRVYGLSYSLTVMRQLTPSWTGVFVIRPQVSSDFESPVTWDAVDLDAAAIFLKHYRRTLTVGYGAAYGTNFGTAVPIPLVQLLWSDGDRWRADCLLPAYGELVRAVRPDLELGLRFDVAGGRYSLDPDAFGLDDPQLERVEATLGPVLRWRLSPSSSLGLTAGWTVHRETGIHDGDEEIESYDPERTGFARVELRLGL